MPERWWIPVLAAALGLIGGVAGAYVGGEVSNKGQQQQFENQRQAELQDLLIDAYARYLRDASDLFAAVDEDKSGAQARTKALARRAFAGETEVEFLAASGEVDLAAQRVFDAAAQWKLHSTFVDRRQDFIDAAGRSLTDE